MNLYGKLINRRDAILLIVDIQKVMFDLCLEKDQVKKNLEALIDLANILELPVILTEHNAEKLGRFDSSLINKCPNSILMNKTEFSCIENDSIRNSIRNSGKKTIILAGIESHVCIFQTGAHAIQEGYNVHAVSDGISARTSANMRIGINRLEKAGAVISSTEMLIFELLLKAGTHDFKKMLPVIKSL